MCAALCSMTGFGRGAAVVNGWRVRIECKSVNHRRLNIRVFTPDELRWLELPVIRRIEEALCRGSVEVRVDLEPGAGQREPRFDVIDDRRFAAVASELNRLAAENDLATPISVSELWEYREFFEQSTSEVFSEEQADQIMPVFEQALDEMVAGRLTEGQGIRRDLVQHLEQLSHNVDAVEDLRVREESSLRARIDDRLRTVLEEFDVGEVDETRVAQEIAFYVEKGDISEEIQRARSHVIRLGEVLDSEETAVGKKIDFYLQELIREANTMGSKSRHAALTELVIEMKSGIEKMREQAANVE